MKIMVDIDENVFTRLFDNGIEVCAIVNDDLFKIAESIRKGKPFDVVLDKIKAEIEMEKLEDSSNFCIKAHNYAVESVLQIIDKYKAESEE